MATKFEDDSWNKSLLPVINFDDDSEERAFNDKPFDFLIDDGEELFYDTNVDETNTLPIHSIISKRNLDLILDEIEISTFLHIPPVEETIKKMILDKKYVLSLYRTFAGKMELLDAAVATWDGNIIINVLIYLSKTLKKQIFLQELLKKRTALKHYINYLIMNNSTEDLADLCMFSGNDFFRLKDLFYFTGKGTMNKEHLHRKLERFMVEQGTKFNMEKTKSDVCEYIKFIKWQIDKKQNCDTITEQLAVLFKNELNVNKVTRSDLINQFNKTFKISDFQFQWIELNVLASLKMWKELSENFIIKSNWLMKKNVLKSCIKQEIFIMSLYKHKAPKYLLEEFLLCVNDNETSLYLAKKMQCHKFIIDMYITQRDRIALINYKSIIPAQATDLLYTIDGALRTSDKKWKN